ncbi:hypothetical protein C8Q78DRAFT_1036922 [Trametes maxima]|nr:hypothetical protein C8Q78DRAFT_1036922 [Trametes maxima]
MAFLSAFSRPCGPRAHWLVIVACELSIYLGGCDSDCPAASCSLPSARSDAAGAPASRGKTEVNAIARTTPLPQRPSGHGMRRNTAGTLTQLRAVRRYRRANVDNDDGTVRGCGAQG